MSEHLLFATDRWQRERLRLAATIAPSTAPLAIFDPEVQRFAAALFAAWDAGRTVVVPQNLREDSSAALRALGAQLHAAPLSPKQTPAEPADVRRGTPVPLADVPAAAAFKLLLFTSGTTAAPKAIAKTLRHFTAEAHSLEALFGASMQDGPIYTSAPHWHIYGLLYALLWPLQVGRPLCTQRCRTAAQLGQLRPLLAARPGTLVTTPTFVQCLRDAGLRWPAQRLVVSSGGPLTPELAQWARTAFGCPVAETYGSTETGGIAVRWAPQQMAWTPMPRVAWEREAGRLRVTSPYTCGDGSFLTHDLVHPAAGAAHVPPRFMLGGRCDRRIKIHEQHVDLDRLEGDLCASPLVARAQLSFVSQKGKTPCTHAEVVLSDAGAARLRKEGHAAVVASLRAHLRPSTLPAAVPAATAFRFLPL